MYSGFDVHRRCRSARMNRIDNQGPILNQVGGNQYFYGPANMSVHTNNKSVASN